MRLSGRDAQDAEQYSFTQPDRRPADRAMPGFSQVRRRAGPARFARRHGRYAWAWGSGRACPPRLAKNLRTPTANGVFRTTQSAE